MKLDCNGIVLADSFSTVVKAISSKSKTPILDGIKLSAYGDLLTLTATDGDFTIINTIKADIKLEGDIVIYGKLASELFRKMSTQFVGLDCIDKNILNIKYGDSFTKMNCMDVNSFPKIDYKDCTNQIKISQKTLKNLIDSVAFSAATDDSRPTLKGCLLKKDGDDIVCVALDGYRLAIAKANLKTECDINLIIPSKALHEVSKILSDSDELISLKFNDKRMVFEIANTVIITTLIEGMFLDYKNLLNKQENTQLKIEKSMLLECLDRVSVVSRYDKTNYIIMDILDNMMTLSSKATDGEINEKLNIIKEGKDISVGINSKYLNECINAIKDDYLKITFNNNSQPINIMPLDGDGYFYLILPVRISNR